MRRKLGAVQPFGGEGAGPPSNTMWPGPRPTCTPSFTLIHPTFWPQYTKVTDRQDRERSDSIWRTVFRNGLPKIVVTIIIVKAEMHQIRFRLPDPAGGAYSAPSEPLAGFKGPNSKGGAVAQRV